MKGLRDPRTYGIRTNNVVMSSIDFSHITFPGGNSSQLDCTRANGANGVNKTQTGLPGSTEAAGAHRV
ncbi:MAG: hypothetical protein M1815_003095 [Lichina confinis]|nr:MAG: hypothetical protein M1815_003095 [Lichina confinis]